MFEWLSFPWVYGLALAGSILLGRGLQAAENDKTKSVEKRKPCQMKDGTWLECRATENSTLPISDYAFRKADKVKKASSPLVLIAGGPGQAAREAFLPFPQLIEDLARDNDLILFNPRGTTNPAKLACPIPETLDLAPLTDSGKLEAQAKDCLKSLGQKFDLNDFGTDAAVKDLDKIREEFGYEKLSLYGISYGTRLALRYAALYPDRVDKMVLEGVVPPEAFIGQDTYAVDTVIQGLAERCARTLACSKAYGDVASSYQKIKSDFARPRTLEVNHPRSGKRQTITIDSLGIDSLLLGLLYTEMDQTLLPAILHQAAGGNLNPLLAAAFASNRSGVYEGLYYAIACTEDAPYYDSTKMNARMEQFVDICLSYPFKPTPSAIHNPVKGPWPTLLLSGEMDPVTPPALLKGLKADLSASKQVIVPGKGHNVFGLRCVSRLIKDFLKGRDSEEKCEEKANLLPFYIEESKR